MFHFDFSKCKPLPNGKPAHDHPADSKHWHPVAEALRDATMAIGLGRITTANSKAFYERLSVYQRIAGPLIRYGDGVVVYVTREDVDQYIGMNTNASDKTEAEFTKHMMKLARESYPVTKYDNLDDKHEDGRTACEVVEAQAVNYAAKLAKTKKAASE